MVTNTRVNRVKQALLAIPRRSWEQGEAMQAFFELRDYDTLAILAREVALSRLDDGRTLLQSNWEMRTVTDPAACGEAMMMAAKVTGDPLIQDTVDRLLSYLLKDAPRSPEGILYHVNDAPEFWVDSIYMLPPFLAAAGYVELAVQHVNAYWETFWDEERHLMRWIWNDEEKRYVRTHSRSICNGYVVCGILRVIGHLPETMKTEKDSLMEKAKLLMDGILAHIDDQGVCHDTLDNPDSIIGINAVSMVAGSIYRALEYGYLDATYRKKADRLRESLYDKIDPYGFLWGVCGIPNNNKTGISANGQSFFLMMEAAYEDLINRPGSWFEGAYGKEQTKLSDYVGVLP